MLMILIHLDSNTHSIMCLVVFSTDHGVPEPELRPGSALWLRWVLRPCSESDLSGTFR